MNQALDMNCTRCEEDDVGGVKLNINREYWLEILESKFGDIAAPNYSFVLNEIERKPYQKVVEKIRRKHSLTEDLDENNDVSFGYLISPYSDADYLLRISMIAPFAFLASVHRDGSVSKPIFRKIAHDKTELELIEIIELHGITLLDAKTLNVPIPRSKHSKPLYQWLFVDEEKAPWC